MEILFSQFTVQRENHGKLLDEKNNLPRRQLATIG